MKAQVLLYTCERQVLRVGVTEHLQGKKIEVHVCFIDVQDRKNKQKKRETGKMLLLWPQMRMFLMAGQSEAGEPH